MARSNLFVTRDMFESEDEVFAFFAWLRYYIPNVDDKIKPYLSAERTGPVLKRAREALFMTYRDVAKKLNMSVQALSKLEKSEECGTISLNSLEAVAEALGCELVYSIVPRSRLPFSITVWKKLYDRIKSDERIKKVRKPLKGNALANLANAVMNDAKFRRQQNWNQHRPKPWRRYRKNVAGTHAG